MKIVVLDGYGLNPFEDAWAPLKEIGEVIIYESTSREQLLERCKDAEIILTHKTSINEDLMKDLSNLKYIGVFATGYNIVDIVAARDRGIVVTNIPDYSTDSVAQMVFALILEHCFRVQIYSDAVRDGNWYQAKDEILRVNDLIELRGKTIGIIGYGNIGRKVMQISLVFGMEVLLYSRTKYEIKEENVTWVDELDELLENSDFISIHCPLFEETRGLINKNSISKMKKNTFLINTARGPIIVEQDLADALNSGRIAGAGLDVLSKEPPEYDNPLLSAKNCIITPHMAWATKEARDRVIDMVVKNIKAYLNGNAVNVVN